MKKQAIQFTIRISKELKDRLDSFARKQEIPTSIALRELLKKNLPRIASK